MFEHLDDPDGFIPGPGLRVAVARRSRTRRRRAWLARGSVATVLAVAGLAVGSAVLVDRKLDRMDRVEVGGLTPDPVAPTAPYTVLMVGADRTGLLAADDPLVVGRTEVDGVRSDTIVVARVDPASDVVTVLPLPRDLYGEIPGHDDGRLNQAIGLGGPSLLVDTIRVRFGLEVNRYVQVDFAGTIAIADAVGGLRLSFPVPLRDHSTGLDVGAGCQLLDGRQVLALARSRHVRALRPDGRWVADPTSDRGRIERQQAVGAALLAAFGHLDRTDPGQAVDLVDALAGQVVVDDTTTNRDLLGLARDLAGSRIDQRRLPVVDAIRGGADVLEPAAGAGDVLEALAGSTAATGPTVTTGPPTTGPGAAVVPDAWATPGEFLPTVC